MSSNEKQKLAEAATAPGETPVPIHEFQPLGERVQAEQEILFGVETKALAKRWSEDKLLNFGPDNQEVDDWRDDLNVERVARYLTSSAALTRSLILESDGNHGRIESRFEAPCFEVYARPHSVLAREQGLKDGGRVRLYLPSIASHIGADANVPALWGEYAWRAISATIGDAPHALPRLSVRIEGNAVELQLAD